MLCRWQSVVRARRTQRIRSVDERRSIGLWILTPEISVSKVARPPAMDANPIFNWLKDGRAPAEKVTAVFRKN